MGKGSKTLTPSMNWTDAPSAPGLWETKSTKKNSTQSCAVISASASMWWSTLLRGNVELLQTLSLTWPSCVFRWPSTWQRGTLWITATLWIQSVSPDANYLLSLCFCYWLKNVSWKCLKMGDWQMQAYVFMTSLHVLSPVREKSINSVRTPQRLGKKNMETWQTVETNEQNTETGLRQ